jgi:hypothetical protein
MAIAQVIAMTPKQCRARQEALLRALAPLTNAFNND